MSSLKDTDFSNDTDLSGNSIKNRLEYVHNNSYRMRMRKEKEKKAFDIFPSALGCKNIMFMSRSESKFK